MITNPEQIKEVFNKIYDFEKAATFPLFRLLAGGLASYKGDKWASHRRIINPAFHIEKIKVLVFSVVCIQLECVCVGSFTSMLFLVYRTWFLRSTTVAARLSANGRGYLQIKTRLLKSTFGLGL